MSTKSSRILIKNGQIVNSDRMFHADCLIEDGLIKEIAANLPSPGPGTRVIDAQGLMLIPGGIDPHTHMQFPFMGTFSSDDFYTGTRAALAGGTTCIIDFICAHRGQSLLQAYQTYRDWADPKVCCDYALHCIVPEFNDRVADEMTQLATSHGVNSFKAFLAYPGVFMLEDDEFFGIAQTCQRLGALFQVHAENGKLIKIIQDDVIERGIHGPEGHAYSRPETAEIEATNRAITLADSAGCPLYVVHVMSAKAARLIADSRRDGKLVWGEAIAAGLASDGSNYTHSCWKHAAGHVLSPPLRSTPGNGEDLMKLLANGDLECTGTDHCVFKSEQKALGKDDFRAIPNGVNGVEDRMSVVWQQGVVKGLLDPCKFVAITSTNAAKMFNIYPRKGQIAVGSDADIVLWDPQATRTISAKTHHQNVDFNIFEGMNCQGVARWVLTRGQVVLDPQQGLKVTQGTGRYIETPTHSPYVYSSRITRKLQLMDLSMVSIERDPYTGPVAQVKSTPEKAIKTDETAANKIHTSVRTSQPPGGISDRPW